MKRGGADQGAFPSLNILTMEDRLLASHQRKLDILRDIERIQMELALIQRDIDVELSRKTPLPDPGRSGASNDSTTATLTRSPSAELLSALRPRSLEAVISQELSEIGLIPRPSTPDSTQSDSADEDRLHMPLPRRSSSLKTKLGIGNYVKAPSSPLSSAAMTPESLHCQSRLTNTPSPVHTVSSPVNDDPSIDPEVRKHEILTAGARRFNLSPSKGILYLAENGYFPMSPPSATAVAAFLFHASDTLNKRKIGEYLGGSDLFNIQVLEEFTSLHSFEDMDFVSALRDYLQSFRLPGEAQQIDRILERFARRYVINNGTNDLFKDDDTAYLVAFGLILLNTDLHHPSVRSRMSKKTYVRNNLEVLASLKVPDTLDEDSLSLEDERIIKAREFLEAAYDTLLRNPLSLSSEDEDPLHSNPFLLTFFNPLKEGWLIKQGGRVKNWKDRYCLVTGSCLYYFKSEVGLGKNREQPCGIIPLENVVVREVEDLYRGRFIFELLPNGKNPEQATLKAAKFTSDGQLIEGRHASYLFGAKTVEERTAWIEAIRSQIVLARFSEKKRHAFSKRAQ